MASNTYICGNLYGRMTDQTEQTWDRNFYFIKNNQLKI